MKIKLLTLFIASALTACGGGGSSSPATVTAAVDVATASQATATQAGLVAISATSGDVAFDVAADIGDTWRIFLNTAAGTYRIVVLKTQYGLQDKNGTFTTATVGNKTVYTGTNFTVTVDNRTKLISGNVVVGSKSTSVAGSGYSVSDLTKLAGTYFFLGTIRDQGTNANNEVVKGSFNLRTDGSLEACENGVFNASGVCSPVIPSVTPQSTKFTLAKDTNGIVVVKFASGADFGAVHVHAGDRGPVLIIDRFGYNNNGTGTTLRVGTLAAVKQAKLGTEINGSYACVQRGASNASVTVNGTSAVVTNTTKNTTVTETVSINKISTGSALVDLDGVATLTVPTDSLAFATTALPLSSSIALFTAPDVAGVGICEKKE